MRVLDRSGRSLMDDEVEALLNASTGVSCICQHCTCGHGKFAHGGPESTGVCLKGAQAGKDRPCRCTGFVAAHGASEGLRGAVVSDRVRHRLLLRSEQIHIELGKRHAFGTRHVHSADFTQCTAMVCKGDRDALAG